jgi:hypothetical protein
MGFPVQALTGKRTYQWGDEQEKAFDELRNAMERVPVLALPNATAPLSWPNVYSSRSHYSTQELYFLLKQFTFFGLQF